MLTTSENAILVKKKGFKRVSMTGWAMGLACQILLATSEDAIFDKKLKMRVDDMARYICQVLGSGGGEHRFGSVFVTFSGRTPATFRAALHRHLAMRLVRPRV